MKGLILLLIPLLLVSALPAYATNNSLPSGASVDLSFSPSRIPLGYSSTLNIALGAEGTGTDLYMLVSFDFQDWLRWQTSDIKMGNFLYGGVVFRSNDQNLNSDYLQIAVVVPKGNYKTVQVPVTPARTGIFQLNEVQVVTLPIINGNYVLTPDGYSVQGLTISVLQFESRLEVYDPALKQVAEDQIRVLEGQQGIASQLDGVSSSLSLLTSLSDIGFAGINDQHNQLIIAYAKQTDALSAQFNFLVRLVYILIGLIVAVGACLLYREVATYRLSKTRT